MNPVTQVVVGAEGATGAGSGVAGGLTDVSASGVSGCATAGGCGVTGGLTAGCCETCACCAATLCGGGMGETIIDRLNAKPKPISDLIGWFTSFNFPDIPLETVCNTSAKRHLFQDTMPGL